MLKLKGRRGNPEYNREKILEIATEFYKNLYSLKQERREMEMERNNGGNEVEEEVPAFLEEILRNLKINKAAGPDKIENELLNVLKKPLTKLFNMILDTESTPGQWN
jgi:hypothetical protein